MAATGSPRAVAIAGLLSAVLVLALAGTATAIEDDPCPTDPSCPAAVPSASSPVPASPTPRTPSARAVQARLAAPPLLPAASTAP